MEVRLSRQGRATLRPAVAAPPRFDATSAATSRERRSRAKDTASPRGGEESRVKPWRDGGGRDKGFDPASERGPGGADTGDDGPRERPGKGLARADGTPIDLAGQLGLRRRGGDIADRLEPQSRSHRPDGLPNVGIIGAGPVGTALGLAIVRAGWPVVAVASRDAARRERFRAFVPGVRAFADAAAILEEVELAILAVPDGAIAEVADSLRLYSGQALVHTSGLLGAEVLQPALAAGSQIGAFHPLVSFTADVERSAAAIQGSTIALEGDDRLVALLADLAEALGAVPVRVPRGAKPAYHAAAMLASGGLVALLDAIVTLGAAAGMDEKGALAVYGRLVEQTLANARVLGVGPALTGPVTRGDATTLRAHLASLERLAPDAVELYLAAARREIRMVEERGTLSPEQLDDVRAALAKPA